MQHSEQIVGSYRLLDKLGEGATASVWRVRQADGSFAALKLANDRFGAPDQRTAFTAEVHAAAQLNHPRIVRIFDAGEHRIDGQLRPWFVLELAQGGALRDHLPDVKLWSEVRSVLIQLLDGLAHSHARGLLHRDLKPENLVVSDPSRFEIKITDFGLAQPVGGAALAVDRADVPMVSAGTPHYMPPEQVLGRWRLWRPWTDIYAVGVIAYELVCGRRPFEGQSVVAVVQHQLTADPPPLEPRFPVPLGLEAWIRRCLSRTPWDRFERCADAAYRLAALADPVGDTSPEQHVSWSADTYTLVVPPTELTSSATVWSDTSAPVGLRYEDVPPFRGLDFGRVFAGPAPHALFARASRPVDIPDRLVSEVEDALRACTTIGQVVVVEGPSAQATSLVRQIGFRLDELGAAGVVPVGTAHGLGYAHATTGAIASYLGCRGQDGDAVKARLVTIARALSSDEDVDRVCSSLAALLSASTDPDLSLSALISHHAPERRFGALAALFRWLSARRPLVLVFDDVQSDSGDLALVSRIIAHADWLPRVLVLATAHGPESWHRRLGEADSLRVVRVEPPSEPDAARLVQRTLNLTDRSAASLVSTTRADVDHALDLLAAAALQGHVQSVPDGASVPEVAESSPTAALLTRLTTVSGLTARGVLLLGALGPAFEVDEWEVGMRALGEEPEPGALTLLARDGVLRAFHGTWSFWRRRHHALLLEAAMVSPSYRDLFAAVARAVSNRSVPERARILGHAGDLDGALELLGRLGFPEAKEDAGLVLAAWEAAIIPSTRAGHPARLWLEHWEIISARRAGKAASELLDRSRAATSAVPDGDARLLACSLAAQALVEAGAGEGARALQILDDALALAMDQPEHVRSWIACLAGVAFALVGEATRGLAALDAATGGGGKWDGLGPWSLVSVAELAALDSNLALAAALADTLNAQFVHQAGPVELAVGLSVLARLSTLRGEFDTALQLAERSVEAWALSLPTGYEGAEVRAANLRVMSGRATAELPGLWLLAESFHRQRRYRFELFALLGCAAGTADVGAQDAFDGAMTRLESLVPVWGHSDPEYSMLLHHARDCWQERDDEPRARRAVRLWEALEGERIVDGR